MVIIRTHLEKIVRSLLILRSKINNATTLIYYRKAMLFYNKNCKDGFDFL